MKDLICPWRVFLSIIQEPARHCGDKLTGMQGSKGNRYKLIAVSFHGWVLEIKVCVHVQRDWLCLFDIPSLSKGHPLRAAGLKNSWQKQLGQAAHYFYLCQFRSWLRDNPQWKCRKTWGCYQVSWYHLTSVAGGTEQASPHSWPERLRLFERKAMLTHPPTRLLTAPIPALRNHLLPLSVKMWASKLKNEHLAGQRE